MKGSREISITIWICLLEFVPFCHAASSETFSVLVPGGPFSAEFGASLTLPCILTPPFSAVDMEVRWYRPSKFKTPVLFYSNGKIQESPVDPQYRDRVSLIGSLEEGNVSLKLDNLTLSDTGEYECRVSSGTWYDKGKTSLTLKGLGSLPVLSVTETGGEQVNVTCVSDGWSTQPTVTWRDREGKEIKHNSHVIYKTDSEDLVSVSSWLFFSPSESEWISCSVSLSDQEKREGRVMPLTTKTSAMLNSMTCKILWRALIIMLVISLLSFTVLFILIFILYKKRASPKKIDQLHAETTPLQLPSKVKKPIERESPVEIPETADKETNTGTSETIEWGTMITSKEHLTLDESTRHKHLAVKNRAKEVNFDRTLLKLSPKYMVDVLCKEKFDKGRHYWEVTVIDEQKAVPRELSWYVGVTSHEDKKRKKEPLTPENGYWVLQYERGKGFYVNDRFSTPVLVRDMFSKLGVYLDMNTNILSFFDVDSKSHLYTFIDVKSENGLIPLLSPGEKCDHSLKLI